MLIIVAEKNKTVIFIRIHTRFDNQFKEVVIQRVFNGPSTVRPRDNKHNCFYCFKYLSTISKEDNLGNIIILS